MTAGEPVERPRDHPQTFTETAPVRLWTWPTLVVLAAILALTAGLRIAWIAHANVNPFDGRFDDTVFYYGAAQSLADDFAYRALGRITAHWPPGYPMTLAPVFAIFGAGLWQAKLLNVLLATGTGALTFALGARAFGRRAGLLAALLVAFFPAQIIFSTLILTEVLFGFVFLLFTWLLLRWTLDRKDAAVWQLVALGLLAGYASLIRSEAVMLPMAAAVLWKFAWPGWRTTVRHAAFCFAGVVLVLTPWTIRNAVRFHEFIPLRSDPGGFLSLAFERDYQDRLDRFTKRAIPFSETAGYMARHPWEMVPLEIDKLHYLYLNDADGIAVTQSQRPTLSPKEQDRWLDVSDKYFFAMLWLGIGGLPLWLLRPKQPARLAVGFALVGWTTIEIVSWPFPRYHFAVEPVLCIFAAGLVVALADALIGAGAALSGRSTPPGEAAKA